MDYIIDRERLNKVFAIFLERTFKDLRLNELNHLVDGRPEDGNFLGEVMYFKQFEPNVPPRQGEYIIRIPEWSRLIKPLSTTFGNMWEVLLVDYVQDMLPDYLVSKVYISK